jgi:hypothetical protein
VYAYACCYHLAYQSLGTKRITAKISTENKGSIQLFLTQLGFVQISYSEIFGEVTLERVLPRSSLPDVASTQEEDREKKDVNAFLTQFETLELDQTDLDG